MTLSINVRF